MVMGRPLYFAAVVSFFFFMAARRSRYSHSILPLCCVSLFLSLWPPYAIEQAIIFLSCGFFFILLLSCFFLA